MNKTILGLFCLVRETKIIFLPFFDGCAEGEKGNRCRAGAADGGCEDGFVHRRACGDDIVDDGHIEAVEFVASTQCEAAADVLCPSAVGEPCLRAVVAYGDEVVAYGCADGVGNAECYFFALVVAAAQFFAYVHRHGEQYVDVGHVEAVCFGRKRHEIFAEEGAEHHGQLWPVVVFCVAYESGICVIGVVAEPCPHHAGAERGVHERSPVGKEFVTAFATKWHCNGAQWADGFVRCRNASAHGASAGGDVAIDKIFYCLYDRNHGVACMANIWYFWLRLKYYRSAMPK